MNRISGKVNYGLPERVRNAKYLAHIHGKGCLICGMPGDAHHLQFAQPRALGRKTGDQWAVPLCRKHHLDLHSSPMREPTWWALVGIDPKIWARNNYAKWIKEKEWK